MNPIIVIPARMNSVRLPFKPLADIGGKPMIVHVMERAKEANIGEVIVACCGKEIADVVIAHKGRAVITDPALASGTDRIYAALKSVDPNSRYDVIINCQGDLPLVNPQTLSRVLVPLHAYANADIGTVACPIAHLGDYSNPNVVKIAMSEYDSHQVAPAWYFSRSPIPHNATTVFHHIGVYSYRREALERFVTLAPSSLERQESLEQLRALEAGMRLYVAGVEDAPQSVDTLEDLAVVRAQFAKLG